MSFSYNTTSPSSTDKMRLLVADTNATSYVFEDEELSMFLLMFDSDVLLATAQALRTLAADKAKLSIYYSVNGFTMDRRDVAKQLLTIADKLDAAGLRAPFEFESVMEEFTDSIGVDRSNYMDSQP